MKNTSFALVKIGNAFFFNGIRYVKKNKFKATLHRKSAIPAEQQSFLTLRRHDFKANTQVITC